MSSLDSRVRGNDGAVVAAAAATDTTNAVGTVGDGGTVAVGDGHVRPVVGGAMLPDDATIVTGGNHP